MSIFNMAYSQEGLAQKLAALNVPLDGTIEIPWTIDSSAVLNHSGEILAISTQNAFGGTTFTETGNKVLGFTIPNVLGGENIFNGSSESVGYTIDNVFGGHDFLNSETILDTISFDTPLGETLFSNDMHMFGIAPEHINYIHSEMSNTLNDSFDGFSSHDVHDLLSDTDLFSFADRLGDLAGLADLDPSIMDALDFLDLL